MTTTPRRLAALAGGLAGVVTLGAVAEARVGMRLRRHEVPVLTPGSQPLHILHLSDFHMLPSMQMKKRWIRELRELPIDLVVNTGDNLSSPAALVTVMEALEPFLDLPGAFVYGSNDYYAPRWRNPLRYLWRSGASAPLNDPGVELPHEALADCLQATGWHDLRNASTTVELAGRQVVLAGMDDPHIDLDDMPSVPPVAGSNSTGLADELRIGVVHAPYSRALDAFAGAGMALVLAGHTHGGQVAVPGYGALVTNCDLPSWRASGLQGWPGRIPGTTAEEPPVQPWPPLRPRRELPSSRMYVHISRGLGTSPYAPIRLFCQPEATLLTLTPETEHRV